MKTYIVYFDNRISEKVKAHYYELFGERFIRFIGDNETTVFVVSAYTLLYIEAT